MEVALLLLRERLNLLLASLPLSANVELLEQLTRVPPAFAPPGLPIPLPLPPTPPAELEIEVTTATPAGYMFLLQMLLCRRRMLEERDEVAHLLFIEKAETKRSDAGKGQRELGTCSRCMSEDTKTSPC